VLTSWADGPVNDLSDPRRTSDRPRSTRPSIASVTPSSSRSTPTRPEMGFSYVAAPRWCESYKQRRSSCGSTPPRIATQHPTKTNQTHRNDPRTQLPCERVDLAARDGRGPERIGGRKIASSERLSFMSPRVSQPRSRRRNVARGHAELAFEYSSRRATRRRSGRSRRSCAAPRARRS